MDGRSCLRCHAFKARCKCPEGPQTMEQLAKEAEDYEASRAVAEQEQAWEWKKDQSWTTPESQGWSSARSAASTPAAGGGASRTQSQPPGPMAPQQQPRAQ